MTTGGEAEAYASYIGGHLEGIADGATYADLGPSERAAAGRRRCRHRRGRSAGHHRRAPGRGRRRSAAQRNSLFKGETLRGLLLSTYAWSTIGTIAGIAAIVAFAAGGVMVVLVVLGVVHRRHTP